jgi:hypothetical protein
LDVLEALVTLTGGVERGWLRVVEGARRERGWSIIGKGVAAFVLVILVKGCGISSVRGMGWVWSPRGMAVVLHRVQTFTTCSSISDHVILLYAAERRMMASIALPHR